MAVTFAGTFKDESGPVIEVPPEIMQALGPAKRPAVRVVINGVELRTTIAVNRGRSYIGLRREIREAAWLQSGDSVEVYVEVDDQPRTVEVPADLTQVLTEDPEASQAFDSLSYSNRKEYVGWITGPRRAATRARRLAVVAELLKSGRRTPI